MSNPLFNELGKQLFPNNQVLQFINEVQNFEKTFKGNPKEEVEKLLSSGKISQAQFNQFAQMANQIMTLMSKQP